MYGGVKSLILFLVALNEQSSRSTLCEIIAENNLFLELNRYWIFKAERFFLHAVYFVVMKPLKTSVEFF